MMNNGNPIPWTTKEILEATGGKLLGGDGNTSFAGVSIDSRSISDSDVFVAIVGDIHNGHAFVEDVIQRGVCGVVIEKNTAGDFSIADWQTRRVSCVAVDDTTRALGDLAAYHRKRAAASVVAITGSNGKTTTRQLTAAAISRQFSTLSTVGNKNNEIGLPLTLLNLQPEHQWAVVELGSNSPGEIARLAEICSAEIGVITNIGTAHLEGLGSLDGVMREKGSLLKKLKPNGRAVLNADDPRIRKLAAQTDKDVILFGLSNAAAVRAEQIKETAAGISFAMVLPEERVSIALNICGHFMVANALAAAAVGYLAGLSTHHIKTGLESFRPAAGRMNIVHTQKGIHIVDDTYNANPNSMQAVIMTLKELSADNRSILISGDMLELGENAESLHKEIGALAAASGIRKIYVTGEFAEAVAAGAREAKMRDSDIFTGTKAQIVDDLESNLTSGDWILVKGSRGMAMEDVVNSLKQWAGVES